MGDPFCIALRLGKTGQPALLNPACASPISQIQTPDGFIHRRQTNVASLKIFIGPSVTRYHELLRVIQHNVRMIIAQVLKVTRTLPA
jgi:hypothetical protein